MPAASGDVQQDGHAAILLARDVALTQTTTLTPLTLCPPPAVQLYLLSGSNTVVELNRLSTPHTSWLLRPNAARPGTDHVERGGDLVVLSRVDPVFAALPMLLARRASSGKSAFQPLDALLVDDANVDCAKICSASDLEVVCDTKSAMGNTFYMLNCEKADQWLRAKVSECACLPYVTREDAVDIVSSYVGEELAERLRKAEQLTSKQQGQVANTATIGENDSNKTAADDGADLAYAEMFRSAKENAINSAAQGYADLEARPQRPQTSQPAQKKRRTVAQTKLVKADMRGVRTMTAFFSKKG
jgi:hypothetical protein